MFVGDGGEIGNNFGAGWGSVVTIEGGRVGKNFEAVGSQVVIAGGSLGEGFDAFHGSVVNVTGGSFGERSEFRQTSDFTAHSGSVVTISGGSFGPGLHAAAGSEVHLVGAAFFLNGLPVEGLTPGQTLEITTRGARFDYETMLTGILLDGSEFSFHLNSDPSDNYPYSDYFDADARLTITQVLTADFNGDGVVDANDLGGWTTSFAAGAAGDSDGDLDTDGADFLAWQRQLGGDAAAGMAERVPEPTTCTLIMATVLGACLRWRRRGAGPARRPHRVRPAKPDLRRFLLADERLIGRA
jgi:hypothetical protein